MVYFKVKDYDGREYSAFSIKKLYELCNIISNYDGIKEMNVWGYENDDYALDNNFKLPSKLKVLRCYCGLNDVPELPDTLEELVLQSNGLDWSHGPGNFPKLPEGLKIFKMNYNRNFHPPPLPNSLVKLDLSYNTLITLIHNEDGYNRRMPDDLEELIIDGANCTVFCHNLVLPPKLKYLSCRFCDNSGMFCVLPDSLLEFDCRNNKFTSLPRLPPNLRVLRCSNNCIKEFPKLPHKLEELDMMDNAISSIVLPNSVELQKKLKRVCLCGNRIEKLPDMILKYAKTYFNYARNPIDISFSKYLKSDSHGCDHRNYIKVINAVRKLENWFLNAKYNPKHGYCKKRLMDDYNDMFDNGNKRLKLG